VGGAGAGAGDARRGGARTAGAGAEAADVDAFDEGAAAAALAEVAADAEKACWVRGKGFEDDDGDDFVSEREDEADEDGDLGAPAATRTEKNNFLRERSPCRASRP
jgi:hypothetical protein